MRTTKCRKCGQEIYFEKTKTGKFMPKNVEDNEPHWATCSNADSFRKPKKSIELKTKLDIYVDGECSHNQTYSNKGVLTCQKCGMIYNDTFLEWIGKK